MDDHPPRNTRGVLVHSLLGHAFSLFVVGYNPAFADELIELNDKVGNEQALASASNDTLALSRAASGISDQSHRDSMRHNSSDHGRTGLLSNHQDELGGRRILGALHL